MPDQTPPTNSYHGLVLLPESGDVHYSEQPFAAPDEEAAGALFKQTVADAKGIAIDPDNHHLAIHLLTPP